MIVQSCIIIIVQLTLTVAAEVQHEVEGALCNGWVLVTDKSVVPRLETQQLSSDLSSSCRVAMVVGFMVLLLSSYDP